MINTIKKQLTNLKTEESGQGAAEYILLFGGVIVMAVSALIIYNSYFSSGNTNLNASSDIENVRNSMNFTT
ncbi:MAG: class III signal peptide-containing protein [Methanobrevibacter sp.]|jgi:hypothetical protein|nr:class III signal peptide-containing protein [Candidatus Methanoflexus mossambicus]